MFFRTILLRFAGIFLTCAFLFVGRIHAAVDAPVFFPAPQKAKWSGKMSVQRTFKLDADGQVPSSTVLEYSAALKKQGFIEAEGGIVLTLHRMPVAACEKIVVKPAQKKTILDFNSLQEYSLNVRGNKKGGGAQVVVQACGEDGFFYALQTLSNLWQPSEAPDTIYLYKADIIDFPVFPTRGLFEGGYGAWDVEGRLKIIDWMGKVKLNSYLYGPKSDPKIRRRWRELYDDIEMFAFKRLAQRAKENHVQIGYVISPTQGIEYGGDDDFRVLMQKIKQMLSVGMKSIVVAFDDTLGMMYNESDQKKFANLGEAEAFLVNKVYDAVKAYDKEAIVVIVPEIYAGVHKITYTETLAQKLNPDVYIGWTGLEIGTQKLDDKDVQAFIDFYKRPPGFGDNWGSPYPFVGRAPDLHKHMTQFVMNPYNLQGEIPIMAGVGSSEPELMPVQGAALSDFSWNPYAYNPDDTLDRMSKIYFKDETAQNVFKLIMHKEYYDFTRYYTVTTDYLPPMEKTLTDAANKKDEKMLAAWLDVTQKLLEVSQNAEQIMQDGCADEWIKPAFVKRAKKAQDYFAKLSVALKKIQDALPQKGAALDDAVKEFVAEMKGPKL